MESSDFVLVVEKANALDTIDNEWANYMFLGDVAHNGPQDLQSIKNEKDYLTLTFGADKGLYYAIGRLDSMGIVYRLGKTASINEVKWQQYLRRYQKFNKLRRQQDETPHKVQVKMISSLHCIDENVLWYVMNCRNDLHSVSVKESYADLSFLSSNSAWYTAGYYEQDPFYDVSVKE